MSWLKIIWNRGTEDRNEGRGPDNSRIRLDLAIYTDLFTLTFQVRFQVMIKIESVCGLALPKKVHSQILRTKLAWTWTDHEQCTANEYGPALPKVHDPVPNWHFPLKVNIRNNRVRSEIFWKLTIKTPEWRQWRPYSVFIIDFEHISHLVLVLLMLILNK